MTLIHNLRVTFTPALIFPQFNTDRNYAHPDIIAGIFFYPDLAVHTDHYGDTIAPTEYYSDGVSIAGSNSYLSFFHFYFTGLHCNFYPHANGHNSCKQTYHYYTYNPINPNQYDGCAHSNRYASTG